MRVPVPTAESVYDYLVRTADRDGCAEGEPSLVYAGMFFAAASMGNSGHYEPATGWALATAAIAELADAGLIWISEAGPLDNSYSGLVRTIVIRDWGKVRRKRGHIGIRVRRSVFERDNNRCLQCETPDDLTLDHVVPWSLGGSDEPENLQTLCRSCNSRKSNRVHV